MLTEKQDLKFRKYLKRLMKNGDSEASYQIKSKWYLKHFEDMEFSLEESEALKSTFGEMKERELSSMRDLIENGTGHRMYEVRRKYVISDCSFEGILQVFEETGSPIFEGILNEVICKRKINDSRVRTRFFICFEKLEKELVDFKAQYIEMCKDWAANKFNGFSNYFGWTKEDWKKKYGVLKVVQLNSWEQEEVLVIPLDILQLMSSVADAAKMGKEQFVNEAGNDGDRFFTDRTHKLTYRLISKGLNVANMKIQSARVGKNIDSRITDGKLSVHARTILAHGDIIKPHYRYIIT